jgi:D-proline reductase (dithiol) PrdB
MASFAELPLKHRLFLHAYRFRRLDPVPWTPLPRGLDQCRIGLVTTAGFHVPGTAPFDEGIRGGDTSFRGITIRGADGGRSSAAGELVVSHRSSAFDTAGVLEDVNLALPVDRFIELEREGVIGRLHEEALSFMGSITAPGRLVSETAPAAAARFRDGGVEVAFLCPV